MRCLSDPCAGVECPEDEQCHLDDVRRPVCRCSDDVTRCSEVPRVSPGDDVTRPVCRCSDDVTRCSEVPCVSPGDDVRRPVCRCSDDVTRCSEVPYAPVCASDWSTYPNDCLMKTEACRQQTDLEVMWRGSCNPGLSNVTLHSVELHLWSDNHGCQNFLDPQP